MEQQGLKIGKRSFLLSLIILLALMLLATALSQALPSGRFERTVQEGRELIVQGSYQQVDKPAIALWRFFTAPLEVFVSPDAAMVITIIAFLLLFGGSFTMVLSCGMVARLMERIVQRFSGAKSKLLMVVSLVFMLFGAVFGVFEETIILVPFCIALARKLGYDSLTGLGISLLSSGLGFGAALVNPFTLGVVQQLAGLPAFSGLLFRALVFLSVYAMLQVFLLRYVKKITKNPAASLVYQEDQAQATAGDTAPDPRLDRGLKVLGYGLLIFPLLMAVSFFVPLLSQLLFPLIALIFVLLAFVSVRISKVLSWKAAFSAFLRGMAGVAPAILLIVMAMSVKLILTRSMVMDHLLHLAASHFTGLEPMGGLLLLFLMVLLLEFVISSGSAKAFLVMPLLLPLTDLLGINRQVAVQAYLFGDGFSNLLYPTNVALMLALGITVVSYPKWLRFTLPLQAALLVLSLAWLLLAQAIGLGPF